MSSRRTCDDRRRNFLGLAAGNVALATIAAVGGPAAAAPVERDDEKRPQGYRETEHLRRYYRLSRY